MGEMVLFWLPWGWRQHAPPKCQ